MPTSTLIVGTTRGAVETLLYEPRTYRVLTNGQGKHPAGLLLGSVTYKRGGWWFYPMFQRQPSRRGWPTAEAALKGRVFHYELEAVPSKEDASECPDCEGRGCYECGANESEE